MKKGIGKAIYFTQWGNSLLNQLSAITRNRRKREASKRRREKSKKDIRSQLDEA